MTSWEETPSDYNDNTKRQKPVYSQSYNRGGGGRGGNRRNEERRFDRNDGNKWSGGVGGGGGSDEKTITIDRSSVGIVLGRGGSNIREMENNSHCRIFVSCFVLIVILILTFRNEGAI